MKNKKNGISEMPGAKPMKRKPDMKLLGRVFKMLVQSYPVLVPIAGICIVLSAIVSSIPSIFMQKVFDKIDDSITIIKEAANASGLSLREFAQANGAFLSERWAAAKAEILPIVGVLIVLYVFAIIFITLQTQLMAKITQGFLDKLRREMFNGMQNLPIKYFDTHKHGDIMSYYTNDIDTLRELVSRSFPQMLQSGIIVLTVFCIMMWYSIPMTLVVMLGVVAMIFVSKKIGGGSAKYFIRNQKSVAKCEGYVQEMMNGQKVIKVFCHEGEAEKEFDAINDELYEDSKKAHAYANVLGPIIMNIGNILYVICAVAGGLFITLGMTNLSFYGLIKEGSFTALAFRISIIIPFLNMTKQFTGNVNQLSQQINSIVMGMAGAGKTTITNLINRFYDIADGKIRYDGININKIKKSDLRRSLGIVLQETNLFTGSVMDNIRYGRLDATDEECIEAARLAGADDFISRLPQGYNTELSGNGANLSQGQRQLIAIARAAVADPPVMILDEATSSIDTRTEAIVQRGMDKLMEGRTVFVIAHRLSTVMNSDVIMVLDHGRIIERGNHEKLIAEKGVYYQLYTGAFELE